MVGTKSPPQGDNPLDSDSPSLAACRQFLATVSHDLRSPVSAILLANTLIKEEGPLNTKQAKFQKIVDRNAQLALDLLDLLLDAHLIRSGGQIQLRLEPCNLLFVLRRCLGNLMPAQQELVFLKNGLDQKGIWDAKALERVFSNLIQNALKYGDNSKRVFISAYNTNGLTNVSVKNFGTCIPEADLPHIFDSNYRSAECSSKKRGWGLGLTLVKGICEAHGGRVSVISNESEGTVFTISLPNFMNNGNGDENNNSHPSNNQT